MGFYRSLAGMVQVELATADIPGAMSAINAADIPIFNAGQADDVTIRFSIHRRDYRKLMQLAEKRGESLRLKHRQGLYWKLRASIARPVLLSGLLILLLLILYLPSRVLFVKVDGNSAVPDNQILEAAGDCGIRFGASRREVRSERVKNALLEKLPQLQWAGVNTSGCVATISVRERSITEHETPEHTVTSVVAIRDGIITSCTATEGKLLCAPGQAVRAGEVLISGYEDCGISIRATRSQGEVFAQTMRHFTVKLPSEHQLRREITHTTRKISLLIGKKRINLWNGSGISPTTCGRMYEEYYVTLPGGFRLPLALAVEEFAFCESETSAITQEKAEAILLSFADQYVTEQMVAGQIQSKAETVFVEDGFCQLTGEYVCTEMIGRVQREQIGDTNGKSD